MFKFKQILSTTKLNQKWNDFSKSYFQTKEFLQHAEKYNPCEQRYYECYKGNEFIGGAIMYSIRLDLLTFIKVKSPIKMNIVEIPASVSSPGFFG